MRSKPSKIALTAAFGLALAFTFGCSSGGDDVGDNPSSSSGGGKGNDIANYKTVKIGTKTWMAENLNYNVAGSKCYDNSEANCKKYGRLYDWATAMALPPSCNSSECASHISAKHAGICPSGWHIPSDAEWGALMQSVNPSCSLTDTYCEDAGTKLKSKNGWNYDGNGMDDYDFSALPGGVGDSAGNFYYVGNFGSWWNVTEYNASYAYYRRMVYDNADVYRYSNGKSGLLSVRCVQN